MIVVVMGVAGSGKTTVGQQLAANLGWRFVEGDDFHPAANVAKMARGQPLTDADRAPWLHALRREMVRSRDRGESLVVTCSALKASYRAILRGDDGAAVQFVYLKVDPAILRQRLQQRQGHFMPASLLASQLAELEEPEDAIVVSHHSDGGWLEALGHYLSQITSALQHEHYAKRRIILNHST
jgi:gluconokinase